MNVGRVLLIVVTILATLLVLVGAGMGPPAFRVDEASLLFFAFVATVVDGPVVFTTNVVRLSKGTVL